MTTATWSLPAPSARAAALPADPLAGRGWNRYLVLVALLVPFVVPVGPAQLAVLDLLNLAALVVFAAAVVGGRVPVVAPFAPAVLLIAIGSLLAVTNAESAAASALSLAQDAYLYAWFVLLVAVMSRHGDLVAFRVAWVLVSVAIAVLCMVQAATAGAFPGNLLAAQGFRPAATFYGPNMAADFLVLGVFVGLSLLGRGRALWLVAAVAVLLVGLLTTKSNGSLVSLVAGLGAAAVTWALRRDGSVIRRIGAMTLLLAAGLLGAWAHVEWGGGGGVSSALERESILGRMDKSSAGRQRIWNQLGRQLREHPLGIGPGNSALQTVEIGHRVRTHGSFQSKEAHSDYIGYAVERGPIAVAGLVLWTVLPVVLVLGARRVSRPGADPKRERDERRRLDVLRAAFVGGLIATAVHSTVIEKLHFRHYWIFLALACAATAGATFRPAEAPSRPLPGPGRPA
jgi:O-antigen ligase